MNNFSDTLNGVMQDYNIEPIEDFAVTYASQDEIDWLIERAKGEFGIITTAATNVSKEGKAWQGEFGVYNDYVLTFEPGCIIINDPV